MSDKVYKYSFKVPLHDTDAAGVVFFAHLFRHAHDAFEAFQAEIGFALEDLLHQGRFHLPLSHAEADYLQPIRHGDQVLVTLQVARLGEASFAIEYSFTKGEREALAKARTVHVLVDRDAQSRPPLPDDLRNALKEYLKE